MRICSFNATLCLIQKKLVLLSLLFLLNSCVQAVPSESAQTATPTDLNHIQSVTSVLTASTVNSLPAAATIKAVATHSIIQDGNISRNANGVAFIEGDWRSNRADKVWFADTLRMSEQAVITSTIPGIRENFQFLAQSPNKNWIAFTQDDSLWVMPTNNPKQARVIALYENTFISWCWSPNNSFIAVLLKRPDGLLLRIIDVMKGSFRDSKVDSFIEGGQISWSPNGDYIAVAEFGSNRIYLVRISDNQVKVLGSDGFCGGTIQNSNWSPDSTWIAAYLTGNGIGSHGWVCVMNVITNEIIPVNTQGNSSNPVWAKGGQFLYIVIDDFKLSLVGDNLEEDNKLDTQIPNTRIIRFRTDTKKSEVITLLPEFIGVQNGMLSSILSPNEKYMSIFTNLKGIKNVFIYDIENNLVKKFTINPDVITTSARIYDWSHNNTHLVFLIGKTNTPDSVGVHSYGALYSFDVINGTLHQITSDHWMKDWIIISY